MNAAAYLSSKGWRGENHAFKEGGLAKPLLVSRKRDLHGVGKVANPTDAWWNNIFDSQLKSINIRKAGKKVGDSQTEDIAIERGVAKVHAWGESAVSPLYSMFIKGGILRGTGMYAQSNTDSNSQITTSSREERSRTRKCTKEEKEVRRKARAVRRMAREERKELRRQGKRSGKMKRDKAQ